MQKCWICEEREADSREHKAKASDLRSIFGKNPAKPIFLYQRDAFDQHRTKKIKLQGSNDIKLKWSKSLCRRCNDTLTQPYDRAWEVFLKRAQSFSNVWGHDFSLMLSRAFGDMRRDGWVNLHLYFAKAFGCAIFEANKLGAGLPHLKMFANSIRARNPVLNFYLTVQHADQVQGVAIQALDFIVFGQQLSWAYRVDDLAVLMAYLPDGRETAKSLGLSHPNDAEGGFISAETI